MKRCIPWFAVVALAVFPLPVGAQVVDSPHGDFREDCRMCHTPNAWSPMRVDATFDHDKTGFPLRGAHADTPCLLCHDTLEFETVQGSQCADCHQDVHLGELGVDCARCHSTRDFIDRSEALRQHRTSRFPLTGAHLSTDCAACHPPVQGSPMRFLNTPMSCDACHAEEYRAARNPDHVAAGFPMDCSQCHSTLTWGGGDFDHALTGFALTGAHRATACAGCHTDLVFTTGLSSQCASCHLEAAQAAVDPNHTEFSTSCAACHSTNAWRPASFDHAGTAFPLTGAHRAVSCIDCHTDGTYAGTPADCFACHQAAYEATTQPQHTAAGFGTDCASCHSTIQWLGATFDHDGSFFPIYSGPHRQAWNDCADCHINPNNYVQFECILCHEHANEAELADKHRERNDYQYLSSACYACHPDGRH